MICGIIIANITNMAGTERAVSNLANILAEQGHKVFIISTNSQNGECPYLLKSSVEIIHCGIDTEISGKLKKLQVYSRVKKVVRQICSEKEICLLIGTLPIHSFIIAGVKNAKQIICEHFNYASAGKIFNSIKKIYYPKMDSVVVLTEKDKKSYSFLKNVFVIPNSLSFETKDYSDCESKEIIAIGRLTKQKGFDSMLKACNIIKKGIPDWHVSIYGEGEDKELLENLIENLQLSDFVTLKPYTKNISEVYKNASLYIMTSRWEGLPMVLIESQQYGLPAVSFDCCCGPSDVIVDGKTGYLVTQDDIQTFSEKVIELAKNSQLRKVMGKNAKDESQRFSTEKIKDKWLQLFSTMKIN